MSNISKAMTDTDSIGQTPVFAWTLSCFEIILK